MSSGKAFYLEVRCFDAISPWLFPEPRRQKMNEANLFTE